MILDSDQITIADLRHYQRFNVIGTSGCGKSAFSRRLAEHLQLPYIEMDQLFWKANWTEPADTEFFSKLGDAIQRDSWVLDGNYTRTTPIKWPRTELVIWLDIPFHTILAQVTWRSFKRALFAVELWPDTGNVETFKRSFFSRKSVIWWSVSNFANNRRKYRRLIASNSYPNLAFLRLSSRAQVDALFATDTDAQ